MPRFTTLQRQQLKELITDCITYRLSEKESLAYIRSRLGGGIGIGASHYYRLKKQIESDSEVQNWLSHFSRVGFVLAHKQRMDEMLLLQKTAFQMLAQEQAKPDDQRDQKLILSIMAEASKLNERLVSLASGSPILAQLSAMLQGGKQPRQPQIEQEEQERLALLSPRIHGQILSIADPERRREIEEALIAAEREEPDNGYDVEEES